MSVVAAVKLDRMANKKKPTGGEHKTPRQNVQFPIQWFKLARQLASGRAQPTLWFLLRILAEEAQRQGVEHPPLPWEVSDP